VFLSRLRMSPDAARSPEYWRTFGSVYSIHQALWGLFSDGPDRRRDFLYRLDRKADGFQIFTLGPREPVDSDDFWVIESKVFEPDLQAGDQLRFSLRVNPVVARKSPGEKRGHRHDVVMDAKWKLGWKSLQPEARPPLPDLICRAGGDWLEQRASHHGFAVDRERLLVDGYEIHRFSKSVTKGAERPASISTLDFDGVLTVTDSQRFLSSIAAGIGPAKGLGCGLMMIART
jgi:CRISPR system Cascade subunit CasE